MARDKKTSDKKTSDKKTSDKKTRDKKTEVGVFSPREALFLLTIELKESGISASDLEIADRIGRHEKTVARLKKNPPRAADETTARNLEEAIWEVIGFPWSKDVVSQIGIMRTLIRRKALREAFYGYRFSGAESLAVVHEIHRSEREELTTNEVNHLLVAYHWILPIINDTKKEDYRAFRLEFPVVIDVWYRYLDTLKKVPWATVLRGKISMNEFGSRWSSMTADKRTSAEVRREVRERKHIEAIMNYAKIVGEHSDALHNALAYASRLRCESLFRKLGTRAMNANDCSTVEKFEEAVQEEYKDRNPEDARDFDPFFQWAKEADFPGQDEMAESAEAGEVA